MADSNDWLKGNDNYIGRIGEMVAMRYLQQHHGLQLKDIKGRNKSRKSVDLKAGDTWWSVKCVTDESKTGRTSPLPHVPARGPALRMGLAAAHHRSD